MGKVITYSSLTYELIGIYSDYTLNDTTISDVYHSSISYSMGDGDSTKFQLFIARNIGLIKLIKQVGETDTTWSLVRWSVIQ